MTRYKILMLFLVFGLAGCTDNVDTVCREYRATNNEAIDALMMVTSEAHADRLTVRIFKPLKDRYAAIDYKLKLVRANREKPEFAKEVLESDAFQLYLTDLQINVQRFGLEICRLRDLRRKIIERERELLGDPNANVNPAELCPKLNALLTTPGVLDELDKNLFEPELMRALTEFPGFKMKSYDDIFVKFAKRRATFLPARNIVLVQ